MATQETLPPQFHAGLSRRFGLIQAVVVAAVLVAGGLAVVSAVGIYRINSFISREYDHALLIEDIHITFHEFLVAANQIENGSGPLGLERLRELDESLERKMQAVAGHQGETRAATGEEREESLIGELFRVTADLRALTTPFVTSPTAQGTGSLDIERLEWLAEQGARVATQLVNVHQAGVRNLMQMAQDRLRAIFALYMALLVFGVAAVAIVGRLGNRWITAPLRRLARTAQLIGAGRLQVRVAISSRDEIGQLSHAFNAMADRLEARDRELALTNAHLRQKIGETHALYQLAGEISGLTQVEPTLRWVVTKSRDLLGVDTAVLCLLSPGGDELVVRAHSDPNVRARVTGGQPPRVSLAGPEADVCAAAPQLLEPGSVHAHVTVALRRADAVIGALSVGSATPREFSSDERNVLSGLAAHAALIIDNARLHEEMQSVATMDERRRLSREIHDGLAQTLGMLYLKIRYLRDRLASADSVATVTPAVDELAAIAGSAYDDARQSIYGLRAIGSHARGLVPILSEYVQEFSVVSGVAVSLDANGNAPTEVSPIAEVQVVRIIQEALHNVRRHAEAKHTWVRVRRDGDALHVTVEDDGQGWDLDRSTAQAGQHFGLQTMRERAESLGGTLLIDTAPGRGTRVTATVPLERTQ
jgi:nitrate/nitrite-specific signal transduction histidine kinase